jgi:hypothetical protein
MELRRLSLLTVLSLPLLACGPAVQGEYSGEGTGFLEKINFKDDNVVELTFMGMTREGTYEIDDDKVKINNGGDISILRIDDKGCLVGGGILGTYCKKDGGDSDDAEDDASNDSPEGTRWALRMGGDEMAIEFVSDDQVKMITNGEAEQWEYEADGDEITIHGPEGRDMVFTRHGDTLSGGAEGVTLTFQRES